jgi:hypothetical protein
MIPVQVPELAPPDLEGELAPAPGPGLDPGPPGDLVGDLPAGGEYVRHAANPAPSRVAVSRGNWS